MTHRIAIIPGDGIGTEVTPEGQRALEAAARRFDIALDFETFDFASCDYYLEHGRMLPEDWRHTLGEFDALFFGAVGWPEKVPDHVSLWGSLLQFRREFDQYVNLRPAGCCPASRARWPAVSPATSTSTWCARTPRGNIPASAVPCSRAPTAKWSSRKR
ncbi:tartrate dehydrogenase/decarboxylase [Halomonas elongata]|uniref:Tartrate dehydrogenase/decarboxylase n=1 Tax=Halomonas elongata TaxID=2746 RepID=A0A1B8P6A8_HALEL|nr:tartrate dehydrogenase/decarboxylase [Halomonas elongata]